MGDVEQKQGSLDGDVWQTKKEIRLDQKQLLHKLRGKSKVNVGWRSTGFHLRWLQMEGQNWANSNSGIVEGGELMKVVQRLEEHREDSQSIPVS